MIQAPPGGGGNRSTDSTVIVRRHAAIGDALAATCVATKLVEQGHHVIWQSHTNIHCVLRRHVTPMRIAATNGHCHVNLDGAYENDPARGQRHFADLFMSSARAQLAGMGIKLGEPKNCTPRIRVSKEERDQTAGLFAQYPRPWVFITPRSNAYLARTILDGTWAEAAKTIPGTKFWLGNHAPAPPGIVDLNAQHLDNVIIWLSVADMLVTVDTGPMHIAAALGTPVVAIGQASAPKLHLTDQRDFTTVWPPGLDCLNCQKNACPKSFHFPPCQNIDPALIAGAVKKRLHSLPAYHGNTVAAIIVVHRPAAVTLNRCIEAVINQVNEVVVVRDLAGVFPEGAVRHGKISYVTKFVNDIGYGRKANYAARHTNSAWLLFVNDDAYLGPGSVEKMLACTKEDTGQVTCLLRYPDGSVYYAGKTREPYVRGWGHTDHKHREPTTFKQVTELEDACGCVCLVRRKAFYDAGAFDESFFLYAEDDALALSIRREGYKLLYTPFAEGIHENHLSTAGRPDIRLGKIINESNALFDQKWGWYLTANANKIPGTFECDPSNQHQKPT